jgi:hypothetical protein
VGVAFPLTPAPAYYTSITSSQPRGVYYVGDSPAFTLNKSGATGYSVRDYTGAVVSSGSVSGTTVTPTAPSGGWKPGWYRLYLTGGSTDALFGAAYGSSCFAVLRTDSRFPALVSTAADALAQDIPNKGALGIGTSRLSIDNANAPTTGSGTIALAQSSVTASKAAWAVASGSPYYDAARTRLLWTNFPNRAYDLLTLGNLRFYAKDETIDGSTITVTAAAGTSSGAKLTINAEVYDNLASADAAVAAVNAGSLLVKAFGTGTAPTSGTGSIGNAYFNGVKSVVTTLYPDVARYEGPENEPAMNAETAHKMRLFAGAVHAGNASAKAIGPCPVAINNNAMDPFFAAGGGAYCDEISFHAYNSQTAGDLNLGRTQLDAFVTLLAKYSLSGKTLWQTESTHVFSSVYGVYHPRRSRVPLLMTLQWEQYGVPRERNNPWYDISHGLWAYPAWWQMGDGTLNPYAVLYRVLAEETFGQTHASVLDFGTIGNRVFLGSVYSGASGKTAVLVAQSYMAGATVTLAVTGTSGPLTAVDAFGNTSSLTVTGGQVVVPVSDVPTYLRLPSGASVSVVTCNDWPTSRSGWRTNAAGGNVTVTGTPSPAAFVNDDKLLSQYTAVNTADGVALGTTMPDTLTLTWPTATRLDRVIVWGGCWQAMSGLVDFDVQTSNDGTTWTTQATVTKATPSSFVHGADSTGTGCQRETYWDEQWIFDVKLPAPVTAKAVRLNVRATSYGGEPDAACATAGGQGNAAQVITVQEIAVLCDDNTIPQYGGVVR